MLKFARLSKAEKTKVCAVCHKQYSKPCDWSNESWLNSKYCSLKCRDSDPDYQSRRAASISVAQKGRPLSGAWRKALSDARMGMKFTKEHCENISKAVTGRPNPMKGLKTGKPSWNRGMSADWMKGDKNSNWKGGITPENHSIRGSVEFSVWRTAVFARDGFTCQITKLKGCRLAAHHILNFASHPELRFVVENGITLAEDLHVAFHSKYGKKNNTPEQLVEFASGFVVGQNT